MKLHSPSKLHAGYIFVGGEVQLPKHLLLHIVENVRVHGVGGSLALELEDDHAAVVTGGKHVEGRVGCHHPESVMLTSEGLHTSPVNKILENF